jgi:hypothetical protein
VKETKTMPPPSPWPLALLDFTRGWGNKRHTIRFSVNMMWNLSGLIWNSVVFALHFDRSMPCNWMIKRQRGHKGASEATEWASGREPRTPLRLHGRAHRICSVETCRRRFCGGPCLLLCLSHDGASGGRAQLENALMSDCVHDDELIAVGPDR